MLERVANSRTFLSFVFAGLTGTILFFAYPFPEGNVYLQYIALKDPLVFSIFDRSYILFLFTTPFFVYSAGFSGLYVLSFGRKQKQKTNPLPPYPNRESRDDLFLVVGEVHHPTKIVRGSNPQWLAIPEKGLFTGIGIFGAVGTGKTSCCMRPFAEQLIAYKANDTAKRIGGLVLEVKGDFCRLYYGRNRYTIRDNFKRSLLFMEAQLANSVAEAYRKNHTVEGYLQDSSAPDIDIEVEKVSIEDLRSAPYKATVDFYEIAYSPVDHAESKRTLYTAHFVFLFRDSVPNELIQVNPLGLAITYFREDEAFK